MFGVDSQELLVIVLLLLVVFGSAKAAGMTRELGRFTNVARGGVEEFKDKLLEGGRSDYGSASDSRSDR